VFWLFTLVVTKTLLGRAEQTPFPVFGDVRQNGEEGDGKKP
jgi:hypothetical protein